jgi:HEAT repeat protein/Na+/melibiose symporter-like transporter
LTTLEQPSLEDNEPTTVEKMRGLPWSIVSNAANSIFAQLTFFGPVFILFLSDLNLNNTEIGFLLSLFPFFGLVALFIAPLVARFGYKRTYVTFWGIRKFVTACLLLVPWVVLEFGTRTALLLVVVVTMGFGLCRAIAETGFFPWVQEYVPDSIRGKYSAINSIFSNITGIVAVAFASFVLERSNGLDGYMNLFGIGVVFGFVCVITAMRVPGGAAVPVGQSSSRTYRELLQPARDRNLQLYLAGIGLFILGTVPMLSFQPLFMEERVGLSDGNVVLLQNAVLIGGLLSTYLLGWAADRYGSKPVMLLGIYLKMLLPIAWLLIPRNAELSFPIALTIAFVHGIGEFAWVIGSARLLFVSVVPREKSAQYMAVYYAAVGIIGGVSQLAGGFILDLSAGLTGNVLGIVIDPFTPLFIMGLVLPLLSLLIFSRVRADSRVGMGEFASLFTHGNPIAALDSMVRYYRSKDERRTVAMTQRLGQTNSPLTVEELLEALSDPRFHVRFEAIISISRMKSPHSRLVDALCNILEGTEVSLSVIAAWALGRIGDPDAIPALRRGLDSTYRSIQAHSARALGTLHDTASTPEFIKRLNAEADKGLQMALASALGNLHAKEAIDAVLPLLNSTENEGARIELALSLARMIGDEGRFIRLWRQSKHDIGTLSSQTLLALRHYFSRNHAPVESALDEAAEQFAHEHLQQAVEHSIQLIRLLPRDQYDPASLKILNECADRMAEYGAARVEYILLMLHNLEAGHI